MPVPHPNGSEGWLPTEEAQPVSSMRAGPPQDFSAVPQSLQPGVRGDFNAPAQTDSDFQNVSNSPKRSNTVTSKRASSLRARSRTDTEGRTLDDSAFSSGAGLTGPLATAEDDDALQARGLEAHNNLTAAQKSKISREESVTGKRLAKIIKQEAKTEKVSLAVAIKELENMQLVQRNAVKSEARAQASHASTLEAYKKKEAIYLNAKKKHEMALAELNAETETLDTLRGNSREATERMQDKATEVDTLRKTLAVDNREREVKLAQLKGDRPKSKFWSF
ncbi:hypothetical protein HYPSUDRAFT_132900 [Hypholoma sublateritium FD-334 SS-4]|uniref:DNA binding protein Ncp1 n=1 Tax=Hypholoma sublateritium (strain FD-334 SS-4) TaxID=945553 RepID=A0A0D2Q3Q5_HYPSF|nr:hypothetical protein HYPSUDRAFT_132900 [Hypholoma sublateritium FD-334 SS-4]